MRRKIERLAEVCGMSYAEIAGHSRRADVTAVRRLIWERLAAEGFSYSKIGAEFGRCHNVIIYGLDRLRDMSAAGDATVERYRETMGSSSLPAAGDSRGMLGACAERLEVDVEELTGGSRKSRITVKRYVAYWLLYRNNLTYSQIAEMFNRRAPSVFYGLLRLNELASVRDKQIMREIEKIERYEQRAAQL